MNFERRLVFIARSLGGILPKVERKFGHIYLRLFGQNNCSLGQIGKTGLGNFTLTQILKETLIMPVYC